MNAAQAQALITNLAGAAKAVLLYPPEHKARTQPLVRVGQAVEDTLRTAQVCYVGIEEDILVVDGTPFFDPFPGYTDLMDRMRERKLKRIEFQRGVRGGDLRTLVALLALPVEDMSAWATPRDYLTSQGVQGVVLELDDESLERRALRVYSEAKSYIVDLWSETRLGNIPKGDHARRTMSQLAGMLQTDPNLLLGLTMLSDYDNYTFNHSVNVGVFALALAETLGFSADKETFGLGGMLHDVGKTRVPIEIINKPGKLTDEEWLQMKRHPEFSAEITEAMALRDIREVVLQHHCGYHRRGYPEIGPRADLSEGGQITAVCDVYDSVTTLRPYQRQHTPQEGIQVLLKLKASAHLNPGYVDAFIRLLGIFPVGTAVRLSSGEVGLVVGIHRDAEDRPRLKIVRDPRGNVLRIPLDVDLRSESGGGAGARPRRIVGTLDPASIGIRPADYMEAQAQVISQGG